HAFLREANECNGKPMDLGRYASLFRYKGELLSGDITPAYATLSKDAVRDIAGSLPDLKIILLIRDPVSRMVSLLSMLHRHEKFDEGVLNDTIRFRSYLDEAQGLQKRSRPTEVLTLWKEHAPHLQFRYFFLDD